jgi:hypothetical protein
VPANPPPRGFSSRVALAVALRAGLMYHHPPRAAELPAARRGVCGLHMRKCSQLADIWVCWFRHGTPRGCNGHPPA